MSRGLGGTGLVADDLWLMAHHEVTGRPFLQQRPLGIGLAGGLLAELMLTGCISVLRGSVLAQGRVLPGGELARQVLAKVVREGEPHPVREWLVFLAQTAAEGVARRLERAGYVTPVSRLWRSPRWVPVDPDWAFAPLVRVRPATDAARPLSAHAAVLAGLAAGCGLGFRLDQYLPAAGRSVDEAVGQLAPGLRELIAQAQAAVDGAVLSHRM